MATLKILDAFALMAYFEDEPGAGFVEKILLEAEKGEVELAMSVVNLGEVWYTIARKVSAQEADAYEQNIRGLSIEIVDADWNLTHQAAIYKARSGLSYADCYAAALAKQRQAELVTGDPEFKKLEDEILTIWNKK
ncbi:MAG: type II toxin-antitoxin system VapC family toxin [Chloroflexota bacterium]